MFELFLVFDIMSKPVINMSCGVHMTHFCGHRPRSRRAQRIHFYLALEEPVKWL